MANLSFTIPTGTAGVVTPADNTIHTILQIAAPANQQVKIRSFEIGFRGTTVTGTPLVVVITHQSTAGTGGTSVTPIKTGAGAETVQTTALRGAFSGEPTQTDIIWDSTGHPQLSTGKSFTFSQEFLCLGGARIGLGVLDPSSTGCTANATFYCEE